MPPTHQKNYKLSAKQSSFFCVLLESTGDLCVQRNNELLNTGSQMLVSLPLPLAESSVIKGAFPERSLAWAPSPI